MASNGAGLTPHEVFDNYDYEWAQKEKSEPSHPNLRALGRFARLVVSNERAEKLQNGYDRRVGNVKAGLSSLNQKRKLEKGLRKAPGSLDLVFGEEPAYIEPRRADLAGPGMYRSKMSGEQPLPELTEAEEDEIMLGAVQRAREKLGELPVMQMNLAQRRPDMPLQGKELPKRGANVHAKAFTYDSLGSEPDNERLLARLRTAFGDERTEQPGPDAVSSTSSHARQRRPYIGHDRLPGGQHRAAAEDAGKELDSTNA